MAVKIYNKKGALGYKEKALIKKITTAIEANPSIKFTTAETYDELVELAKNVEGEVVSFEETKAPKAAPKSPKRVDAVAEETVNTQKNMEVPSEPNVNDDTDLNEVVDDGEETIKEQTDPLNREEPIAREYVIKDGFEDASKKTQPTNTNNTFDEPKSFKDSFGTPDNDIEGDPKKPTGGAGNTPKAKPDPINPSFNDGNSKKKKRGKKFAKYIVEGVCFLLRKGVIWFATKDITEAKLLEYQLGGEIAPSVLDLLTELEDGQEATIKQFFTIQIVKANDIHEYTQDEKDDLADALEEFLEEKGITPNATQNLITVSLAVLGKPVMDGVVLWGQNKGVLAQLKEMTAGKTPPRQPTYTPPEPTYTPKPEPVVTPEPTVKSEVKEPVKEEKKEMLEIETIVETKE